ncbi:MAG TPA: multicopper oxidase domain-containing protein [Gemmatimonadales bacterium]|jgi:nitrite reductase (NO-forming)|nr:multicopper oxidase domain-containing protein [Gemmatimonadales bacterium]
MLKLSRITLSIIGALGVAGAGLLTAGSKRRGIEERVDFGATRTATSPAFDVRVRPVSPAPIKQFRIPITHDTIEIAAGVKYVGWTFGGTVPGPVIRVRQGDLVRITVVNEAKDMPHSIDFHASRIPMDHAMKPIAPGDSLSFEFTPTTPGVFMVHCGTAPVLLHIAQGMYLPIIVDPEAGWPGKVDKEFVVVQSEFYPRASAKDPSVKEPDWDAMLKNDASYVVFNGKAGQYQAAPLQVEEGDRVRFFVVNAGPNRNSDFHIVGAIFDKVYPDGDPAHVLHGIQTQMVPAGGGMVFETSFAKGLSGTGHYAFVTHAFADASRGAVGVIQVGHPKTRAAGH